MREVRNDGRKLINMDINFVHEGKNKNDTMKENNEVNQLWIERSGRDSWRRWYLSQDWRRGKKINQVTWIRAFQREHQGLEPWKGDNEPCSVGDGGSWVIVLEKKGKDEILRSWESWLYSKWTWKPQQDGDHPNHILKRPLWPLRAR